MTHGQRFWRKLDRGEFENWLRSLPHGFEAGTAGDSSQCPIGRYIEDFMLANGLVPDDIDWWTVPSLPRWARDFITRIDDAPSPRITREVALKVLSGVRP